jgi:hypothetical protein
MEAPVGDRQNLIDKYNGDTTIPIFCFPPKLAAGINLTPLTPVSCMISNPLQRSSSRRSLPPSDKEARHGLQVVFKETVDEDIYGMHSESHDEYRHYGQRFYRQRSSQRKPPCCGLLLIVS